jgi:hypothetical protein
MFHAFQENLFRGSDQGSGRLEDPDEIKIFDFLDQLQALNNDFKMDIKSQLPLFGLFVEFIRLNKLKNPDKMWGDWIIKRTVLRADLNVGIPTFKRYRLIVVAKVELLEGLCKSVRISLGKVFVDLAEKDLYCSWGSVL